MIAALRKQRRRINHEHNLAYIVKPCLRKRKKPGMVAYACNPSYMEGRSRRIADQG
jgi:hypothetical protein